MNIYIVFGSCGEYEDYNVWPVKAFFSEKNAKAYARMAEFRARQIEAVHGDQDDNEYDPPNGIGRYAPVDYGYEAVEVGDSPTQEAMDLEETDMQL